jgi:hypothetical protein
VELTNDPAPSDLKLILQPGRMLRLRVVDTAGNPIAHAQVYLKYSNIFDDGVIEPDQPRPEPAQVDFHPLTDSEGRVSWSNAPDADLTFVIAAAGHTGVNGLTVHPDGLEHAVTLGPALVVHGTVLDGDDGQPVPHFKIVCGYAEKSAVEDPGAPDGIRWTNNPHWSSMERDWLSFNGGKYNYVSENANPGFMIKIEADGFVPCISRILAPDEGNVELNVVLVHAKIVPITVYTSDGQPAAGVDIGFVSPGSRLRLNECGFKRQSWGATETLLKTDAHGVFNLADDPEVARVMAACPDGFAESTPAALAASPTLQLQPWGRLEVTILSGGKPAPGREYQLELGGGNLDFVIADHSFEGHNITDEDGRFEIDKIPPGRHTLIRLERVNTVDGPAIQNCTRTEFDMRPGETRSLVLDEGEIQSQKSPVQQ